MSEIRPQRRGDETATGVARVRAAIVDAPGGAPRVGSVVLPRRTPGSALIDVIAAPVNPLDLLIASGQFHSARHEEPYVPGSECVGVVVESDLFAAGTRVYAVCQATPSTPGAFAAQMITSDENLLPLPEGVDPVAAAAVGNSGMAAYMPLVDAARLTAGETVMVLGATGAVGQIAIQIAHGLGAARVIGVGRNRDVLDRLLSLGADAVVDLRDGESADDLVDRLQEIAGPVDVILDGLWGTPLEASLRVCAPNARVVNIGHLAGATATLPAGALRGRQISLIGFSGLHTPLEAKRTALESLWGLLERGELDIPVRTFFLEELPSAWREQASSPHAKCVILPTGVTPVTPDATTK